MEDGYVASSDPTVRQELVSKQAVTQGPNLDLPAVLLNPVELGFEEFQPDAVFVLR